MTAQTSAQNHFPCYFVSAPIRLFIFDNRIEIISPGHRPNNLTIEKILAGNSNIRNPILVSNVATYRIQQRHQITIPKLAKCLGITERTVRRRINSLQE